jgi:transcriptional regulator with XRE-family HTH domain
MDERRAKVSEQVRRAIRKCGVTRYAIAKATGIDQATLSRFMSGQRGLPMKTLDVLGEFLGLRIVMGGRSEAARRRKGG